MKSISIALGLVALLTTPVFAEPLTRSCDYKGDGKLGPLTIDFDEVARSVRVTTQDGRVYRYQDGVTGRISPASSDDDLGPVEQFVNLRPDRVEVGFLVHSAEIGIVILDRLPQQFERSLT